MAADLLQVRAGQLRDAPAGSIVPSFPDAVTKTKVNDVARSKGGVHASPTQQDAGSTPREDTHAVRGLTFTPDRARRQRLWKWQFRQGHSGIPAGAEPGACERPRKAGAREGLEQQGAPVDLADEIGGRETLFRAKTS
jgi:hypothetical protein